MCCEFLLNTMAFVKCAGVSCDIEFKFIFKFYMKNYYLKRNNLKFPHNKMLNGVTSSRRSFPYLAFKSFTFIMYLQKNKYF